MDENEFLAQRFEEQRARLRQVAYRMLGSTNEADDAVQEAWIRLSRYDTDQIESLGGWLTTVVERVCLDMLRARASKREDPLDAAIEQLEDPMDPEGETLLADAVGVAMLAVLETLSPAERIAFVLHDIFAVPFDQIAPMVDRSRTTTRKLASRARTRIQGAGLAKADTGPHGAIVAAFLSASREGNFGALLALLDPEVALTADKPGPRMGGEARIVGAQAVATVFSGGAQGAELAMIDGSPGMVWTMGGSPRTVFHFTIRNDRITNIDLIADQGRIEQLQLSRPTGTGTRR